MSRDMPSGRCTSRSRATRRGRHGFVLPFVLLLALVVAMFALVMTNRESVQRRSTARTLNDYVAEHLGKGVREVVGGWIKSLSGQPIEKLTEGDGHALDLTLPDGTTIAIYLSDGQGSLRESLGGLETSDAEWLQIMLDELEVSAEAQDWRSLQAAGAADGATGKPLEPLTRQAGPIQVSLQTVPPPVLLSILRAITGKDKVDAFVEEIERSREDGEVSEADLGTASASINLSAEERATLNDFITTKPELWRLRAEVRPTDASLRSGARPRAFAGLFTVPREGGGGGVNAGTGKAMVSSISPMGPFLEWNEVQVP